MQVKMVTALFFSLVFTGTVMAQQRPNIILVMADDMGYSDIGCFGSEIPTPNLDLLAVKGIRLNQFYNTARCCPTRASLMTGLFPHQTGIGHMTEEPGNKDGFNYGTPGYQGYLNKNCVTVAEVLHSAGYHTYMTGKWHLGFHGEEKWPLQRGFEKFYGILAGASSYFKPSGGRGLTYNNTKLATPEGDYYTTDAFTDSAISFVAKQNDDHPFFLYLAYNAPHWPLQAKEADIKQFEGKYLEGWDKIRAARFKRQKELGLVDKQMVLPPRDTGVRAWDALTAAEKKEVAYRMAVYAAQVSSIDQNIGKLVASLKSAGKLDNTLIIFLSDNGACPEPYKELGGGTMAEINDGTKWGAISYGMGWANASNTPYRKWKRELEEGGLKAPFIMCWPKGIKPSLYNSVSNEPSYLIDMMPTLLELANTGYPVNYKGNAIKPLEGRSMAPLLTGNKIAAHEFMYWEHEGNQAIRKGNWKAVKGNSSGHWQLYDLSTDKAEEYDLGKTKSGQLNTLVKNWELWANTHLVFPVHVGNTAP